MFNKDKTYRNISKDTHKEPCKKEILMALIPEDYKKHIIDIEHIISTYDGSQILILKLSRDQHLRFKSLASIIVDENIQSLYAEHKGKYFHIGGTSHIVDKMNNCFFYISPDSLFAQYKYSGFYKKILQNIPKGKTRNAIILNTHGGLIPLHLAHMYNRLYCVDVVKSENKEAGMNLKLNKINNCLLFNQDYKKWLLEFNQHKHTPPGKRNRIGLVLVDADLINVDFANELMKSDPETIIVFSRDLKNTEKALEIITSTNTSFGLTLADQADGIHFRRIKNNNETRI
jgi:hypothetical protein